MVRTIRTLGNGGLFGYYGGFRNQHFGSMSFYATRRSNYVVIVTNNDRRILLTPDDPALASLLTSVIPASKA